MLQGVVSFYSAEDFESDNTNQRLSFMFGLILFGNMIDNMNTPKAVAITLQICLAVTWVGTGV